jgi:spermidine/putrescine transport system permease protein
MFKTSPLLNIFAFLVYLFLYVPIIVLIVFSFDSSRLAVQWTGFTLNWYRQLFADQEIGRAFINSLIVAFAAVIVSGILGTLAALGLSRYRFGGKDLYRALIVCPIILPEIAMAVSALVLFVAMGLRLGLLTIIVSHIVFCISYVSLTVLGRLQGMDPCLEEAAQDLGAPPIMAFFKITLPLLSPGLIAGCLLAFVLSLDDFVISQFTAGVGCTTLPLRIYSLVKFGISPEINALSTVMIVGTVGLTLLADTIQKQWPIQTATK